MRTRIALAAAATAALSIGITNGAVAGVASGTPTRAARPARPARSLHGARATRADVTWQAAAGAGAFAPPRTATVPRFLAPALSAVDRRGAHRRAREETTSPSVLTATQALAAHTAQMERVVDAWRAAHPAPVASPPPPPVVTDATSTTTPDWACIRDHESGDRFNTPAAPGGAYGFLEGTWLSLGYGGWPYQAPPAVQDHAVLFLYNELGWQPWSTRVVCGL
jgi:hypothetical protein